MAVCPNCHEQNPEVGAACPRCNGYYYVPEDSVSDAKSDPRIGRLAADKFIILGLISEGGMGAVYRALQLPVEREVAFKVLRTELKDSDNGRDRFEREARAVSRLNHPNIITLYDFGFEDGKHPYMVMEYAPGKSLAKWLKTEQVTIERIVHVTAQILNALTEAHDRGIVHRDLKPENMIISKKGAEQDYVKLLDFGIARMINEGATRGLTREGEVFGTPHYMAPEQAQGKKELGPPADIYAVGIMMYEMVTGQCPFDAPTPLAVLFMHINDPLPPITPREGVFMRPELAAIIQRACSKNPDERYQDASQMFADLMATVGFSTGALPGMVGTEASHEYALGETIRPPFNSTATPPPAMMYSNDSGVQQNPQQAGRQPHFTPGGFQSGVMVNDPEASLIDQSAPDFNDLGAANANTKKLGAIAAVAVALVAVAIAALLFVISSDSGDPEAAEATTAETATPTTETEIAANRDQPAEIEVEALEPEEAEVEEPTEVAEEVEEPEVEPKDQPEEKTLAAPKPEPKKAVQKKEEPEPKKAPQKKAEPKKTTESKTSTPKEEPTPKKMKWAPKAQPWNRK